MVSYAQLKKWDPDALDTVVDDITSVIRKFEGQQESVDAGRPPESWVGVAADTAFDSHQRLVNSVNDMISPLSAIRAGVNTAAATIRTAKADADSIVSTVERNGWTWVASSPTAVKVTPAYPAGAEVDEKTKSANRTTANELETSLKTALQNAQDADTDLAAVLGSAKRGGFDGGTGSMQLAELPEELRWNTREGRPYTAEERVQLMLGDPAKYGPYTDALTVAEQRLLGEEIGEQLGKDDLTTYHGPNAPAPAGKVVTDTEVARLNELLKAYGTDSTVATSLLTSIGQQGFLAVQSNLLGSSVVANSDPGAEPSPYLVTNENVGASQRAWGDVLAAATNGDTARYENVSQAWINDLVSAPKDGDQFFFQTGGQPNGPGLLNKYQLLGPLLHNEHYGKDFLLKLGDHMEEFERANMKNGGHPWSGIGTDYPLSAKIDFTTGGFDMTADHHVHPSGLDPFGAYFDGLSHDPEAAREFLAGPLSDPEGYDEGRNERIGYYMNNRTWGINDGDGYPSEEAQFSKALLVAAVSDDTDTSADIARDALHYASAELEDDRDITDSMRRTMSGITSAYMRDTFDTLSPELKLGDGTYGDVLRSNRPDFDKGELERVIQTMGKDSVALDTFYKNATDYAQAGIRYQLDGVSIHHHDDYQDQIDNVSTYVTHPYANALALLENGAGENMLDEGMLSDQEKSEQGDFKWQAAAYGAQKLNGLVPYDKVPVLGSIASDGVDHVLGSIFDSKIHGNDVDTSAQVAANVQDMNITKADGMTVLMAQGVYDSIPPHELPDIFQDARGQQIPMSQWTAAQEKAWEASDWRDKAGFLSSTARTQYEELAHIPGS